MPRICTVCAHAKREAVDAALLASEPYRDIAGQFGLSKSAVERHRQDHIAPTLAKAAEAEDATSGDSLLAKLTAINRETQAILKEARADKNSDIALKAIARVEKQLELEAKLLGELNDAPQINFNVTVNRLQAVILSALEPFPAARLAVAAALAEAEG
jgi:transposase-like protein